MKFNIKNHDFKQHVSCIIVEIFETSNTSIIIEKINTISNGYIKKILQREKLEWKIGQTLLLHQIPNLLSDRLLIVGCGKNSKITEQQYREIIKKTINIINETVSIEVIYFFNELSIQSRNVYWKIRQAIEIIEDTVYSFNQLKSSKDTFYNHSYEITFHIANQNEVTTGQQAINHGMAISKGVKYAKDLGNMPPNICNSNYLLSEARKLKNNYPNLINIKEINENQMKKLGMNAYLAVGSGSMNQSIMIIIEYKNDVNCINTKPIVLIGKGMTFDTGGISIKPSKNMDEMKYDMCGAAAVYGIIKVAANLNLPLKIIGILAICENMIGSKSLRPGDILKTLSGMTVEVLNTDAEGRLVLCDTLTYAITQFNPEIIIDIATLTGACVVALGYNITGLISNCNNLTREIIIASKQSYYDQVWQLPLSEDLHKELESNFADISNIGSHAGGAITAGYFLSCFVKNYSWAHLDIAGTAWTTGKNKSATGRPVPMISQFLLNRTKFNNLF